MGNKKVNLNTVVDTLQCDILREKMRDERILLDEHHAYIKPSTAQRIDDNYNRVKISPKHLIGYENTNSSKNIDMAINTIAERIGVTKMDIDVNRMDISVDSNLNYADYKKFHLYLFELITYRESHNKKILCTSLESYEDNNIYLNSRDLKLAIYDKGYESKGEHPYSTRIEFRWIRYTSLETDKMAKRVINKLKDIENNNVELEGKLINKLSARYEEEKKKKEIKTFTEFVRKYDKFFYTRNIIKGVYETTGYKGSFKEWLRKFKENQPNFRYYTLKDIKTYRNAIVKSVKAYIKS
ncbi:hypothetical protein [Clostridium perfringens]|uniref:hypothetical protein n=3 Tax=Clostridium perfringens TaxID=1502 RepID=UPI0039ECD2DB